MIVFLLIFESLGTSELILIGIVALIFLGPRRLPEIARKAGKIMAEFRQAANEFRETWEREVNFEEEAKLLRDEIDSLRPENLKADVHRNDDQTAASAASISSRITSVAVQPEKTIARPAAMPLVRPADPGTFRLPEANSDSMPTFDGSAQKTASDSAATTEQNPLEDKRNWL
ncbi:MAG: twin-arginine translocase subunit TatB [Blastocatellia bacterium]